MVAVLLTLAVASSATVSADYKDEFESGTWSGSDGSLPWSTSWARQGNVTLASGSSCNAGACMRMGALTTLLQTLRATRGADTGVFDGDFNLRFRLKAGGSLLGGSVKVMVRADGGGWDTVKTYSLGSSIDDHPTITLDESFRSETFEVRFEYTAALLGSPAFIDDVEIQGAITEETTTTSTTTTTTTTAPQTTTTPSTTSTTQPPASTTSTTRPPVTTSTTTEGSTDGTAGPATPTTSTTSTTVSASSSTTTTTLAGGSGGAGSTRPPTSTSTTTSNEEANGTEGSGVGGTVPDTTGIRASARGLQADFQGDLYGDVRTVSSLDGVDVQVDYNMAVEVIESSWAWMVLLGLLVAYSIITGLDRRRRLDA